LVHSFTEIDYLETFPENKGEIYGASSVDKAMKNAFTQTRKLLMAAYELSDAEASTIITTGVDFAVTQVVDGNFGVHAVIQKALFEKHTFVSLDCPAACVNPVQSRRKLRFGHSTIDDCSGCYEA